MHLRKIQSDFILQYQMYVPFIIPVHLLVLWNIMLQKYFGTRNPRIVSWASNRIRFALGPKTKRAFRIRIVTHVLRKITDGILFEILVKNICLKKFDVLLRKTHTFGESYKHLKY